MKKTSLPWTWRLQELAQQCGIHGPTELSSHLSKAGYSLSIPQASRLLRKVPEKLDLHLLAALCKALDLRLGQLFDDGVVTEDSPTANPPATRAVSTSPLTPEQRRRLIGPAIVALHPVSQEPGLRRVD